MWISIVVCPSRVCVCKYTGIQETRPSLKVVVVLQVIFRGFLESCLRGEFSGGDVVEKLSKKSVVAEEVDDIVELSIGSGVPKKVVCVEHVDIIGGILGHRENNIITLKT